MARGASTSDLLQRADVGGLNSGVEDLVTGADGPTGVALDLTEGKLYWAETLGRKIVRANLDGSDVEDVVTGLVGPRGIALDLAGGRVYWANNATGAILRANLDGTQPEAIVTDLDAPLGVALQ